jgi:hypothetical protein
VPTKLTGAYELYCPGTPVGDVVLNDAQTSAAITPASPNSGDTFNVTNYQVVVNLPSSLASAAQAVNPAGLAGSATAQLDVSGATPATLSSGTLTFNITFPSPIPSSGVPLSLPATPGTLGPFTATSTGITVQQDSSASLHLTVAGQDLALTCSAYPNNSVTPSGIATSAPTVPPIAPVIAIAGGGSQSTTTVAPVSTTTKAPATGSGGGSGGGGASTPVAVSSRSLAFTGPGPGIGMLGVIGGALILLGFALLVLVDAPRRALSRLAYLAPTTLRRFRAGDHDPRTRHWGAVAAQLPGRGRQMMQAGGRVTRKASTWLLGR